MFFENLEYSKGYRNNFDKKKIDLQAVMVKITVKAVNTFLLILTYITCIKTL